MSVPVAPSGYNTFIPDHESSGRMVVDFSRDPKKFALPRYCQYVPVKKNTGFYLEMTVEEAGRIVDTDMANFYWPDGAEAPKSRDALEEFNFLPYRTKRYAPDFVLGDLTAEQATWDVMAQHLRIKSQQMMTGRTVKAVTALTTTGNYASSHHSDVASISGNTGNWAASTTARQDIKRSLNYAAQLIELDTLSSVDEGSLMLVIGPSLAAKMSESQEIVDHIKGSPEAYAQVKGELPGRNSNYGLPDKIYGYDVIIEKTARVSTRKGATTTKSFVMPNATAVMCSRVGGLVGVADAPSFSTLTCFLKEEMTVEKKHDVDNRRMLGRVVDDFEVVLTAPVSGFVFTNAQ